jgi:hypothetical protein
LRMWKKYCNIFIPDFIPICWVKDIDLKTVSVLEIWWRAKGDTPRCLYSRKTMCPILTGLNRPDHRSEPDHR